VAVALAVCGCLSAVSGQWLEKTIALSDSFGNIRPWMVHYVPSSNCIYVADDEDGVVVLDAAANARVARMDLHDPSFFAYDSRDDKVYLSVDDTVAVIDPSTHHVISRLEVGRHPSLLCYNSVVNKLYCRTGPDGDSMTVIDCRTDSVKSRIWVGWCEYEFLSMSCVPAGSKVYVASFETGSVAVIDGVGDSLLGLLPVGDYPGALVYSPVSNKLYCAVVESSEVAVFDGGPDTLLELIDVGSYPFALGYSPLSNKVYSANLDADISVIDCSADTIAASFDIPIAAPTSFLFDSVDNRIFCFDRYYDSIPAISCSGDTLVGPIRVGGDAYDPGEACYSPQQNRIYIAGRGPDDVFVADAASRELVTDVQMYFSPLLGCYAEPLDKFYCSDEESGVIAVVNCSTDSLERRIFTPASELGSPVYSSGSNKLYYNVSLPNGRTLLVVNCASDSFEAALPMNSDGPTAVVYNPVMDRIYWARAWIDSTVAVIDCERDSVVADLWVGGYPTALACNPDSNRMYCATYHGDSTFVSAIDCATDSVIGTVFVHAGYSSSRGAMCYVPSRDVVVSTAPDSSLVVVDGKAQQLLQTVELGGHPSKLHLDRVTNKLFCVLQGSDELAVVDCRNMTLDSRVRLAARLSGMAFDSIADRVYVTSPDFGCISLVDGRTSRFLGLLDAGDSPGDITWIPQHRRMYVVDEKGQAILVVRDTSLAGIDGGSALLPTRALPTVVDNVLYQGARPGSSSCCLLDISGRKVLDLKPGVNDVRALAPGVYFVRSEPSAVTKVVITR
jgi:YVTN family beta-propeller protein